MKELYLEDQGEAAGPYPIDQVKEFLRDGIVTPGRLASETLSGPWKTLQELGVANTHTPPVPALPVQPVIPQAAAPPSIPYQPAALHQPQVPFYKSLLSGKTGIAAGVALIVAVFVVISIIKIALTYFVVPSTTQPGATLSTSAAAFGVGTYIFIFIFGMIGPAVLAYLIAKHKNRDDLGVIIGMASMFCLSWAGPIIMLFIPRRDTTEFETLNQSFPMTSGQSTPPSLATRIPGHLASPAMPLPSAPAGGSSPFRVITGRLVGLGTGTDTAAPGNRWVGKWSPPGASIRDYIRIGNQTIPRVLIPDLAEAFLICGTDVQLHIAPGDVNILFAVGADGQLQSYIPALEKVKFAQSGARNILILMGAVFCLAFFLILPLMFAFVLFVSAARIGTALKIPDSAQMRAHLAHYVSSQ